jgi:SWI/SNF-related matrix-associated actin-dependent regulator 1 of chromatin subfamily A
MAESGQEAPPRKKLVRAADASSLKQVKLCLGGDTVASKPNPNPDPSPALPAEPSPAPAPSKAKEPSHSGTPLNQCVALERKLTEELGTSNANSASVVSSSEIREASGNELSLAPYQLVGVNFLTLLSRKQNAGGAILADEMGLGKTAQCIAFLALELSHHQSTDTPAKHCSIALVVCPASLLDNWQAELTKWAPSLRVQVYYGQNRSELREELEEYQPSGESENEPMPFDVLLTCYTLFERNSDDQKEDRRFLRRFNIHTMVLDEAHHIKNRGSRRAQNVSKVSAHASFRIMLTGTPLQNDLRELESLLQMLSPDIFAGEDLFPQLEDCSKEEKDEFAKQAQKLIAPFVLRRMKEDVLDQLAPKETHDMKIELTERQQSLYGSAVSNIKRELRAYHSAASTSSSSSPTANGNGDCNQLPNESTIDKSNSNNNNDQQTEQNNGDDDEGVGSSYALKDRKPTKKRLKDAFTHLRKVANHPLLIRALYSEEHLEEIAKHCYRRELFGSDASFDRVKQHVSSLSDFALHQLCADPHLGGVLAHLQLPEHHAYSGGKAFSLTSLLRQLQQEGCRPLIFSQWKLMLDVIEWLLKVECYTYTRLDGDTNVSERQARVNAFNDTNSSIFAFLLSTRAGGQGLNLTGADVVILHDPDYTPSVDKQAIDRAHRIGQESKVRVYKMVATNTVDERIVEIAESKKGLDRQVMADGSSGSSSANNSSNVSNNASDETRTMSQILYELLES